MAIMLFIIYGVSSAVSLFMAMIYFILMVVFFNNDQLFWYCFWLCLLTTISPVLAAWGLSMYSRHIDDSWMKSLD